MRRRWTLLLLLLAAATALPAPARAELRVMKEGDVLPSRALRGVEGLEMMVPPAPAAAGSSRAVTVVVFWATWSPRSLPLLTLWQKLASDYAARPVRVLTVNADHQEMDAEKTEAVRAFLRDNLITLSTAVDDRLALYNELGVVALPTTLYFAADGALVFEQAGYPSSAAADLPEALDRALGIAKAETQTDRPRGQIAGYQPKNNALLYFNMGLSLRKIGMKEKGRGKLVEALQRDPDYPDPLRALEEEFFKDGRSAVAVGALRELLLAGGLTVLADRYVGDPASP
jgi:thiol-disulfide isomerase/thioredoxin